MTGAALGCFILVVIALTSFVLAAAFLHWGAKLSNAEMPFSKAVTAMLIMIAVGFFFGFCVGFYLVLKGPPAPTDEGSYLPSLLFVLVSLAINIFVISKVYTVGYAKGLRIYLTSTFLALAAEAVLVAILLGIAWAAVGSDRLHEAFDEYRAAVEQRRWSQRGDSGASTDRTLPDPEEPIPLLTPVSSETPANAFDIELSRADKYIGKTVRVIHGPESETIGTLRKVTPTSLVVSVKLAGGRVEIPIQKKKITTFQMIDTSIDPDGTGD